MDCSSEQVLYRQTIVEIVILHFISITFVGMTFHHLWDPIIYLTIASEGPAGMSIATNALLSFCTNILAVVTNWLPGPQILSTFGTLSVP